jgi:hypothetical protein
MAGFAVFGFFVLFSLQGCTFNSEEDLYGFDCDTLNINFVRIEPIFQANCVSCHNATFNNGGVLLDSYLSAVETAQTGKLHKAVNHLPGATPMPYQGNKLSDCLVLQITKWIDMGTPQ